MKTDPDRRRRPYEIITWKSKDLPINNSISPRQKLAGEGDFRRYGGRPQKAPPPITSAGCPAPNESQTARRLPAPSPFPPSTAGQGPRRKEEPQRKETFRYRYFLHHRSLRTRHHFTPRIAKGTFFMYRVRSGITLYCSDVI